MTPDDKQKLDRIADFDASEAEDSSTVAEEAHAEWESRRFVSDLKPSSRLAFFFQQESEKRELAESRSEEALKIERRCRDENAELKRDFGEASGTIKLLKERVRYLDTIHYIRNSLSAIGALLLALASYYSDEQEVARTCFWLGLGLFCVSLAIKPIHILMFKFVSFKDESAQED